MKLKQFIEKLKEISKRHEEEMEVIMADNIPVVDPVFLKNYRYKQKVIITDKK